MYVTERRAQFVFVLLAALEDLSDRIPSKHEVERHIEKHGYLKLPDAQLWESYDSKEEEKWKTELAFARAEAVRRNLMNRSTVRDVWEVTETGLNRLAKMKLDLQQGKFKVTQFKFWSRAFHERMGVFNIGP
jgi:hypothetical protein